MDVSSHVCENRLINQIETLKRKIWIQKIVLVFLHLILILFALISIRVRCSMPSVNKVVVYEISCLNHRDIDGSSSLSQRCSWKGKFRHGTQVKHIPS